MFVVHRKNSHDYVIEIFQLHNNVIEILLFKDRVMYCQIGMKIGGFYFQIK